MCCEGPVIVVTTSVVWCKLTYSSLTHVPSMNDDLCGVPCMENGPSQMVAAGKGHLVVSAMLRAFNRLVVCYR